MVATDYAIVLPALSVENRSLKGAGKPYERCSTLELSQACGSMVGLCSDHSHLYVRSAITEIYIITVACSHTCNSWAPWVRAPRIAKANHLGKVSVYVSLKDSRTFYALMKSFKHSYGSLVTNMGSH